MRRRIALLVFILIVVDRVEPRLLKLPFIDRQPLQRYFDGLADQSWRGYPQFLQGVREHTQPGETIAIAVPVRKWDDGYSYAYYRASYILSGREVLPLFLDDDRPRPENLRRAKYVAVWGRRIPRGAHIVWAGYGGALVSR